MDILTAEALLRLRCVEGTRGPRWSGSCMSRELRLCCLPMCPRGKTELWVQGPGPLHKYASIPLMCPGAAEGNSSAGKLGNKTISRFPGKGGRKQLQTSYIPGTIPAPRLIFLPCPCCRPGGLKHKQKSVNPCFPGITCQSRRCLRASFPQRSELCNRVSPSQNKIGFLSFLFVHICLPVPIP